MVKKFIGVVWLWSIIIGYILLILYVIWNFILAPIFKLIWYILKKIYFFLEIPGREGLKKYLVLWKNEFISVCKVLYEACRSTKVYFKHHFKMTVGGLKMFIRNILYLFKNFVTNSWKASRRFTISTIYYVKELLSNIKNYIIAFATSTVDAIIEFFKKTKTRLVVYIKELVKIMWHLISGLARQLWYLITVIWGGIYGCIKALAKNVYKVLWAIVKRLLRLIWWAIKTVFWVILKILKTIGGVLHDPALLLFTIIDFKTGRRISKTLIFLKVLIASIPELIMINPFKPSGALLFLVFVIPVSLWEGAYWLYYNYEIVPGIIHFWYKNFKSDCGLHFKNRKAQFKRFLRDCRVFFIKKLFEKKKSFADFIDILPEGLRELIITTFAIIIGIIIWSIDKIILLTILIISATLTFHLYYIPYLKKHVLVWGVEPYLQKSWFLVHQHAHISLLLTLIIAYILSKFITEDYWDTCEKDSWWVFLVTMSRCTFVVFFLLKYIWAELDIILTKTAEDLLTSIVNLLEFGINKENWEPLHSKFSEWIALDHLGNGDVDRIESVIYDFQKYLQQILHEVNFFISLKYSVELTKQFIIIFLSTFLILSIHIKKLRKGAGLLFSPDLEYYYPWTIYRNIKKWLVFKKVIFDREKGFYKIQFDYCLEKVTRGYINYHYFYKPQLKTLLYLLFVSIILIDYFFIHLTIQPIVQQAIKPNPFVPEMTIHFKLHIREAKNTEEMMYDLFKKASIAFAVSTSLLIAIYSLFKKRFRRLLFNFFDMSLDVISILIAISLFMFYYREYWEPVIDTILNLLCKFWGKLAQKGTWDTLINFLTFITPSQFVNNETIENWKKIAKIIMLYAEQQHETLLIFKKFSYKKKMTAFLLQTALLPPVFFYFIFDLIKNDILKVKKDVHIWHNKDGRVQVDFIETSDETDAGENKKTNNQ